MERLKREIWDMMAKDDFTIRLKQWIPHKNSTPPLLQETLPMVYLEGWPFIL
jgi:hypothetical protein